MLKSRDRLPGSHPFGLSSLVCLSSISSSPGNDCPSLSNLDPLSSGPAARGAAGKSVNDGSDVPRPVILLVRCAKPGTHSGCIPALAGTGTAPPHNPSHSPVDGATTQRCPRLPFAPLGTSAPAKSKHSARAASGDVGSRSG
jgi:hypothetical protein